MPATAPLASRSGLPLFSGLNRCGYLQLMRVIMRASQSANDPRGDARLRTQQSLKREADDDHRPTRLDRDVGAQRIMRHARSHREIELCQRVTVRRGAPKQLECRLGIAQDTPTRRVENSERVLGCRTALFRRHPVPAGSLGLVVAKPEACCVMASEIVLSCGETLRRRKTKEAPSLGGILPHAAAEFTQNTEVILTACIARFRNGLAALVCDGRITALFGGFGSAKIGGSRP
jgi:hypothetical protein